MQHFQNAAASREPFDPHKVGDGFIVAGFSLVAIGTVTAGWVNPFFTRMTPVGLWEIPFLVVVSALAGVFAAMRRPFCSNGRHGLGGLASFLGIACPTRNRILMMIFGGAALLLWFDPIRPWVAVPGVGLLSVSIRNEWRKRPLQLGIPSKSEAA